MRKQTTNLLKSKRPISMSHVQWNAATTALAAAVCRCHSVAAVAVIVIIIALVVIVVAINLSCSFATSTASFQLVLDMIIVHFQFYLFRLLYFIICSAFVYVCINIYSINQFGPILEFMICSIQLNFISFSNNIVHNPANHCPLIETEMRIVYGIC